MSSWMNVCLQLVERKLQLSGRDKSNAALVYIVPYWVHITASPSQHTLLYQVWSKIKPFESYLISVLVSAELLLKTFCPDSRNIFCSKTFCSGSKLRLRTLQAKNLQNLRLKKGNFCNFLLEKGNHGGSHGAFALHRKWRWNLVWNISRALSWYILISSPFFSKRIPANARASAAPFFPRLSSSSCP